MSSSTALTTSRPEPPPPPYPPYPVAGRPPGLCSLARATDHAAAGKGKTKNLGSKAPGTHLSTDFGYPASWDWTKSIEKWVPGAARDCYKGPGGATRYLLDDCGVTYTLNGAGVDGYLLGDRRGHVHSWPLGRAAGAESWPYGKGFDTEAR